MKVQIQYKGKTIDIIIDENDTIQMLKKQLEHTDDSKSIKNSIPSSEKLTLKDLGKQIRWEYVFYIEYLGPILIMPLFYFLGDKANYTEIQCWALLMGILHYLKREYETANVHVFSHYSMPFKRVFINCLHYWVLFALLNSIELYVFPSGHTYDSVIIYVIFGFWLVFEFCNYKCHMVLSGFRKRSKQKADADGSSVENPSKRRGIPFGWGFGMVSCANYFWEALGWIMFSILTRCWTSYVFTFFSLYQMTEWAIKKHKAYKKQFGDKYPKGRKAMYPFIL